MASVGVQVTTGELTWSASDVDMPVESKPFAPKIWLISLPPRVSSLFGSENDDCHWYFLPTNSCIEEIITPSVTDFGSSRSKTEKEKVEPRCLLDPTDEELQIFLCDESVIVGFVRSTHVPKVDVCVYIERDGNASKR